MTQTFIIILFAIGAVAFLVLGYSITYFFRGRHVQTEVGENDRMKALGIKCTAQQIREDEAALRGVPLSEIPGICSESDCTLCEAACEPNIKKSN
ncbi:MAG: hypothetical protein LBM20_02695 [Rikenellaceae bacterium]|jgi:hypothetical protein|nr:hypothetical protein [Rikenellaceae bacterium]